MTFHPFGGAEACRAQGTALLSATAVDVCSFFLHPVHNNRLRRYEQNGLQSSPSEANRIYNLHLTAKIACDMI